MVNVLELIGALILKFKINFFFRNSLPPILFYSVLNTSIVKFFNFYIIFKHLEKRLKTNLIFKFRKFHNKTSKCIFSQFLVCYLTYSSLSSQSLVLITLWFNLKTMSLVLWRVTMSGVVRLVWFIVMKWISVSWTSLSCMSDLRYATDQARPRQRPARQAT